MDGGYYPPALTWQKDNRCLEGGDGGMWIWENTRPSAIVNLIQLLQPNWTVAKPLPSMATVQSNVSKHNNAQGGLSSFWHKLICLVMCKLDSWDSLKGVFASPKPKNPRREILIMDKAVWQLSPLEVNCHDMPCLMVTLGLVSCFSLFFIHNTLQTDDTAPPLDPPRYLMPFSLEYCLLI